MNEAHAGLAGAGTRAAWHKHRCLRLWLLGVTGVLSLLLGPLEAIMPAGLAFTPLQFRLVSLVNPLMLLTLLVPLGCWLASRTGLDAPMTRAVLERSAESRAILARQLGPAGWVGLASGLLLVGYGLISAPWFADAPAVANFQLPLLTRLLFGGVTEELLTRWGLMSLFVWLALKIGLRGAMPYLAGALAASLLFAAGHLPLLFLLVGQPGPALLAAVLVGNALPGFLFGLLFWKRGLEAAMLAHGLAHLVAWTAGLLI